MDTTETQSKSKKPLIIGIICIVVAIAVVGCFVLFMLNEKNKKDHAPIPVAFTFEAADYDSQTGSGVPLRVEGVDIDGNQVSEIVLVDEGDTGFALLKGAYDITVAGSPVTSNGGIYDVPDSKIHIEINENEVLINDESLSFDQPDNQSIDVPAIAFTAIAPEKVTDDQITAIKTWMGQVDFSEDTINKFANAITASRKAALDRIEAEQLDQWRSKLTGVYGGTGENVGVNTSSGIRFEIDGDKLLVSGNLQKIGSTGYSSSLGYGEWHFVITPETKYSNTDEFTHPMTKAEFINEFMPAQFVGLDIKVKDGYVVSMNTGA